MLAEPSLLRTLDSWSTAARPAALALLAALFANPASAALDQSAISSLSGFIGAYAGLQNGAGAPAGGDAEDAYLGGELLLDEKVFSTSGGSANVTRSYSGAFGTNSASGSAQAGLLRFLAANSASNEGFAGSIVHGGWNDVITIDDPALTGTAGVWLFDIDVSGTLGAAGFAGRARVELSAYQDGLQLRKNVGFFDPGASDPISTDRQQVRWAYASEPSGSRMVSDTVTFAVSFTFGDPFTLGVYSFANAGKRSSSAVPGTSTSDVDFLSTLQWGGTRDVLVGGASSAGYAIGSGSGIDWVAAVPTPSAFAMATLGVLLIPCRAFLGSAKSQAVRGTAIPRRRDLA